MNYKITQVSRKNGDFIITIQQNNYYIETFYYERLLPYIGKEIDETILNEIIAFQNGKDILKKYYLKIFSHQISEKDLQEIFYKNNLSKEDTQIILTCIKDEGYLKEDDFINYYMPYYSQTKGKNAFKSFLIQHQISEDKINNAIENYVENEEYVLNYASRFIQNKNQSNAMLKQNLFSNLYQKGYSKEIILRVINQLDFNNEENALKKEICKFYKKYAHEPYKIVSKLANKGYNIADIKKCLQEMEDE